jgi:hypothetical protein
VDIALRGQQALLTRPSTLAILFNRVAGVDERVVGVEIERPVSVTKFMGVEEGQSAV